VPAFLLSESIRGEGGILINDLGEPFMHRYHELKELAPRDIVARSIIFEMKRRSAKHVYLDMRHLYKDFVKKRFPTIYETCLNYGIDITRKPVPIAPAAHYTMGGIKTDIEGRTNIKGLFACGEAACTGVHGANRLASNSILEGLVFGRRTALAAISYGNEIVSNIKYSLPIGDMPQNIKQTIREFQVVIDEKMGPIRTMKGLEEFLEYAKKLWKDVKDISNSSQSVELRNMILIGLLIATSALKRKSSVGAHYCMDTLHLNDKKHISLSYKQLKEFFGEN
jgi:L-aspartate oxidase